MVATMDMEENKNFEFEDGNDENEIEEPPAVKLDFEKLFKMAEDPDMEELLRSPLDEALNQLENGNEIQMLSAIRKFPHILESSDGEKCLKTMLPAIQNCLKQESKNLDLHCEAAVVYKSIIQNDNLVTKFNGIVDSILEMIVYNVQQQKDNISAAAWLETIVEIIDCISNSSIKQHILPVIQQQIESTQRAQRRIISVKIIAKLLKILSPNDIQNDLCPMVVKICEDKNENVRVAISQLLSTMVVQANTSVTTSMLACFSNMLCDEESSVKEAAMESFTECLETFTKSSRKNNLFNLVKRIIEENLKTKKITLVAVSKHFGYWCWHLRSLVDKLDLLLMLKMYCEMVKLAYDDESDDMENSVRNGLKRSCAYNYPCMLTIFKDKVNQLLPFLDMFCTDSDEEVRISVAAQYFQILNMFPNKDGLIQPFIELIHSGSSDVIAKIAQTLPNMLEQLYENVKSTNSKTTTTHIDRLIVGCNTILRNTSTWRSHEALLRSLRLIPKIVSKETVISTYVPMLKNEILKVRAIPCRITACESLLIIMRTLKDKSEREDIINFFKTELSRNSCSYRRIVFFDVVEAVLEVFSKRMFIEHFLEDVIRLVEDPVSNIRMRAYRFLPKIKTKLILPEDNNTLLSIEKLMKSVLMTNEGSSSIRNCINAAAVELSRAETCPPSDKKDADKVAQENQLWDNNFSTENTLKTPSRPKPISPWRTEQRKAIAVVRPQPVIIVRSESPMITRSPSPAPMKDANRPSRLPTAKGRERLSRSSSSSLKPSNITKESSLPPPTGLRRSATSTTQFGGMKSDSFSSYGLQHSRSASCIRRPGYGLSHVSSQTTIERKPSQVSLRVRENKS